VFFSLVKYFLRNKQTRRLTPEKVKALQLEQFRKLVRHASEKSPYYRRLIADHQIPIDTCTPEDFPVLTKSEVMKNFDEIVTDPAISKEAVVDFLKQSGGDRKLFLGKYHVIHTSGTTGESGYAIYNSDEMARGVTSITLGLNFDVFRKMAFIGATGGAYAGVSISSAVSDTPLIYRSHSSFDVNMPFRDMVAALNRLKPSGLSGYPFALRRLAEAQNDGILKINPKSVFSGGESLREPDKKFIQKAFGVQMLNLYASSEFLMMGLGLDKFGGMYLMDHNLIFEFHPYHLCVTNLFNYTLPLIRYQMNDELKPVQDNTRQLPFTKVENLIGRESVVSAFLNDDGEMDFMSLQPLDSLAERGVTGFQIKVLNNRHFQLKVILHPEFDAAATLQLLKTVIDEFLQEKRMTQVQYDVEHVRELSADSKTGKFQHVVADPLSQA
jgi:phenylacetate-CoA ligase